MNMNIGDKRVFAIAIFVLSKLLQLAFVVSCRR